MLRRWRVFVVAGLILAPVLVWAAYGSYCLWASGWGFRVWWALTACVGLGYFLAWRWQRQQRLLRPTDFAVPLHWTERDRGAWALVEARAKHATELPPGRLTELDFYLQTARELSLELARFYHPNAADPFAHLTLPEILAVVELAAHDLGRRVEQYVPGSHLLTVANWQQARRATEWYQSANTAYWLVSAVLSPVETAARYAASRLGVQKPWQKLQQDLVLWFATAYLREVGTYLVDLYSGRLRVGAERFRELVRAEELGTPTGEPADDAQEPPPTPEPPPAKDVVLTLLGQVKAGKSSFTNAVLGERKAQTDVLPATAGVTRYELQPPGVSSRLVLLDTVGYGHTGAQEDQVRATREAATGADLLVLVLHARTPARQADLDMLQSLRRWFDTHPELRLPPILAVLTHIDLLSPAMEWAPPYQWRQPTRPKERQIAAAVAAVREQLGGFLVGVVPVCTAEGRIFGIEEGFLPALAGLLDEAHAVALLRCLRAEADTGKVRRVFHQLLELARSALDLVGHRDGVAAPPGRLPPGDAP